MYGGRVLWTVLASTALAGASWSQEDGGERARKGGGAAAKQTPRRLTDLESLLGRPAETELLWRMVERDLEYGLLEDAQRHLGLLLARPDLDERKALELREKYGTGLFIRLQRHPELAEAAQPLFERVHKAAIDLARDPKRIQYFIGKLDDSRSEQGYAIVQLGRAGPYAVPYFIDALRSNRVEKSALIEGLTSLPSTAWPAVAAALDSDDEGVIGLMIDVLRKFSVPESADFVWFVAGNPEFSPALRSRATQLLARLTGVRVDDLPSPATGLVRAARRFDARAVEVGASSEIATVWRWDGANVAPLELPAWKANEFLGLRAARLALQLAPGDREAQVVFLNLALQGAMERAGVEDASAPSARSALEASLAAGADLMLDVLDRANQSRRTTVALAAVRSLGETADPRVVGGEPGRPTPLLEALDFPNARVRLAAAFAILQVHPDRPFPEAPRVVQALSQALDPTQRPRALVLDGDSSRANATAAKLAAVGYDPVVAIRGREGFRIATESQFVELVVVDPTVREPDLRGTLELFQKDVRVSGLPIVVLGGDAILDEAAGPIRPHRNVARLPRFDEAEQWAAALDLAFPDRALAPWTEKERRDNRLLSLEWLARIARGELGYMDATPAVGPLTTLLSDAEFGPKAADVLAYLPSPTAQARLAAAALDPSLDAGIRSAAARGLAKSLQRRPNALDATTVERLLQAAAEQTDPALRLAMAAIVGCIDRDGKAAGERLRKFDPMEASER
jgi:HEAT repeat protein